MAGDFYTEASRRVLASLQDDGLAGELRDLHRQRPHETVALLALNWSMIAAACWVGSLSPAAVPVAIVVIGWRQRALGNLLHDGSHGALMPGRRLNRWLTATLCGLPLLEDFDVYRACHQRHHKHLGDPLRDPDHIDEGPRSRRTPLGIYLVHLGDPKMIRTSVLGNFVATPPRGRALGISWWVVCLAMISWAIDPGAAIYFLVLFFASRATVYHAIRVFGELCDHVVPTHPDVLFRGTRTMPSTWLAALLNPHHDNYHLAHHLFPRVPTFMLDRLDALLSTVPEYRQAPRFTSYFTGPGAVVRDWVEARGRS